jgi:hypothetical protein
MAFQNSLSKQMQYSLKFQTYLWSYLENLESKEQMIFQKIIFLQIRIKKFVYRNRFLKIRIATMTIQRFIRGRQKKSKFEALKKDRAKERNKAVFDQYAIQIQRV